MPRKSHKIGIDANSPIVSAGPERGALSPTVADSSIIADTGAGWVRINFVLGPWNDPRDETRFQGRTWFQAFEAIVDGFVGKGLGVYGLVGHETMKEDPGDRFRRHPDQMSEDERWLADEWIRKYVDTFVNVLRVFGDRVKVFESFNEPDDWRGSNRNWVHPYWFAKMLDEIYSSVRNDSKLDRVKIVSGPLQGLELNGNAAAPYLQNTYAEGRKHFHWGDGVPFPFDGVGYHIYIHEGLNPNWPEHEADVKDTFRTYVNAMRNTILQAEGRMKPLFVSEIGWFSNGGLEQWQAQNLPLGLGMVARDPDIALGIWFSTQDFGEDSDGKYYGLYRKGPIIPANRKPAYQEYRKFCQTLAETETALFVNQTMINAVFEAASDLGMQGWDLVVKAGLDGLVFARTEAYAGPPVEDLPRLTEQEKAAISRRLIELVPDMARKRGWATADLNMREGPDTDHPVVLVLPPETEVEVLGRDGDWLQVAALGKTGYVHGAYIVLEQDLAITGFLRQRPEFAGAPLEPPEGQRIEVNSSMDFATQVLAITWNRCGGLLALLSNSLRIDPAVAVAVFVVEAQRGQGFADDGRMIIRFENHIFFERWGRFNPDRFAMHFQFDKDNKWQGHRWRTALGQPWREFHDNQQSEWNVFEFARDLDAGAAMMSISMGAPQIMGFNYASIGYESVSEMFKAFSSSESSQIIGFFDFVKGGGSNSPLLKALREEDFAAFAASYNGPGQVAQYSDLLTQRYETVRRLREGLPITPRDLPEPLREMTDAPPAVIRDLSPGPESLVGAEPEPREAVIERAQYGIDQVPTKIVELMEALARANLRLHWALLGAAVLSFVVAIGLALSGESAAYVAIFAVVCVAALLMDVVSRPKRTAGGSS